MSTWTASNLETQGYRLNPTEARALSAGLRFPTALCLALVILGLAIQSAGVILALVPIGAIAGWSSRHPFDLIWNHALRHLGGAPKLPTNPRRRRHAFKLATLWLLLVGLLFALGMNAFALGLGAVLVAVCALVTATNFCLPSTLLAARDRRTHASPAER